MPTKQVTFTTAMTCAVIGAIVVGLFDLLLKFEPSRLDSIWWVFFGALNVWFCAPRLAQ